MVASGMGPKRWVGVEVAVAGGWTSGINGREAPLKQQSRDPKKKWQLQLRLRGGGGSNAVTRCGVALLQPCTSPQALFLSVYFYLDCIALPHAAP